MLKLIDKQVGGVLSEIEWWELTNTCLVIVHKAKPVSSLEVSRKKSDITTTVYKQLRLQNKSNVADFWRLVAAPTGGYFIECNYDSVTDLLLKMDEVCKNLTGE